MAPAMKSQESELAADFLGHKLEDSTSREDVHKILHRVLDDRAELREAKKQAKVIEKQAKKIADLTEKGIKARVPSAANHYRLYEQHMKRTHLEERNAETDVAAIDAALKADLSVVPVSREARRERKKTPQVWKRLNAVLRHVEATVGNPKDDNIGYVVLDTARKKGLWVGADGRTVSRTYGGHPVFA